MYSTVVFDLDGVIIDSENVQELAYKKSFEYVYGHQNYPDFKIFLSHSGKGLECIFADMGLSPKMIGHYRRISVENIEKIKVIDGIRELLEELKLQKRKLALLTGKDYQRTVEILKRKNLIDYFDYIVCSDQLKESKPSPEGLVKIMKELKAERSEMIMVGDSKNDILAANRAEIDSILVGWGVSDILNCKCNPKYIVKNIQELRSIFNLCMELIV